MTTRRKYWLATPLHTSIQSLCDVSNSMQKRERGGREATWPRWPRQNERNLRFVVRRSKKTNNKQLENKRKRRGRRRLSGNAISKKIQETSTVYIGAHGGYLIGVGTTVFHRLVGLGSAFTHSITREYIHNGNKVDYRSTKCWKGNK